LSGRMWFLNWSGNTMMVSKAREPQIRADIGVFWNLCRGERPPRVPEGSAGRGRRECKGYRLHTVRARSAMARGGQGLVPAIISLPVQAGC
jgi:hypothetical protein